MANSLRERAITSFDSLGQTGVAEQRSAKHINRARALGVIAKNILPLVGIATIAAGARQDGLDGAVTAPFKAMAAVAQNAEGEWDFPIFDLPNISFNKDSSSVEITANTGSDAVAEGAESAATAGQESAPAPSIAEGELPSQDEIICYGQILDITVSDEDYYFNKVTKANPELTGDQIASVVNDEGQMLNSTINVNRPPVNEPIAVPTMCR